MAKNSFFSKISSIIVFVLVGILVLSFALWGVADIFNYQSEEVVAKVNKTKISKQFVDSTVERSISQLEGQLGSNLSIDAKENIARSSLQSIINQELVYQEANRLDIVIGEKQIKDFIKQMDIFKDSSGNFSKERFEALLRANNITEERFVNDSIQDIQVNFLLQSITEQNILPKNIEEILYKTDFEKRNVDLVKIPLSVIKDVGKPSENELAEFYEEKKEDFKLPEFRRAKYVTIDYVDLGDKIDASDETLQTLYEQRKDEFVTEEKREILQIRVDDSEKANQVFNDLKSGTNFSDAGKKAGLSDKQMLLGEYSQDELANIGILPDALINEVFAIDQGKHTSIHEDSLGFAILAVSAITPAQPKPFEDVKSTIKQDVINENIEQIAVLANNFQDQLAAGKNIDQAATELDLLVKQTPLLNKNANYDDAPKYGDFLGELFTLNEGESSSLISSDDATEYYVVLNDQIVEPRYQTIDEIRGLLTQKWEAVTRFKKLETLAKSVVDKVKESDNKEAALADIAKKEELELKKDIEISKQDAYSTEMPLALVSDAFSTSQSDITDFYQMADNSIGVVLVKEIIEPEADEDKLDQLRRNLSGEIAVDYREQFIRKLNDENDVAVDIESYIESRN